MVSKILLFSLLFIYFSVSIPTSTGMTGKPFLAPTWILMSKIETSHAESYQQSHRASPPFGRTWNRHPKIKENLMQITSVMPTCTNKWSTPNKEDNRRGSKGSRAITKSRRTEKMKCSASSFSKKKAHSAKTSPLAEPGKNMRILSASRYFSIVDWSDNRLKYQQTNNFQYMTHRLGNVLKKKYQEKAEGPREIKKMRVEFQWIQ